MKRTGNYILICVITSLLGLILKLELITPLDFVPIGILLFTLSIMVLIALLVLQAILAFKKVDNFWTLIISSYSLVLSICFIGILCRYQMWKGWQFLYYSRYLFCGVFVLTFIKRKAIFNWKEVNKRILLKNIGIPLIYALIMGGTALLLSYRQFYDIFSARHHIETYDQFLKNR